jgi:hypothetical protein
MADILCRSLEFTSKKFSKSLPFKELEGGRGSRAPCEPPLDPPMVIVIINCENLVNSFVDT